MLKNVTFKADPTLIVAHLVLIVGLGFFVYMHRITFEAAGAFLGMAMVMPGLFGTKRTNDPDDESTAPPPPPPPPA